MIGIKARPGGSGALVVRVAASDATAADIAAADYTCDGTDDDVQIVAAIADLTAGGTVLLSAGTFNVDPVRIDTSNVTVRGQGEATIVKLQAQSRASAGNCAAIEVHGTDIAPLESVHIEDLAIDGNRASMTYSGTGNWQNEGIDFKNVRRGTVSRVQVHDAYQDGIDLDGAEQCLVYDCWLVDCGGWGIHVGGDPSSDEPNDLNVVAFCYAEGNGHGASTPARGGFDQNSNSTRTTFIGNIATDNYRNWGVEGSGATFIGNQSRGTTSAADVLTGVEDDGSGHALSSSTPQPVAASGSAGSSTAGSKSDHVHAFADTAVRDAGRWETVVSGNPAAAVTTPDGTDWVYGWISS